MFLDKLSATPIQMVVDYLEEPVISQKPIRFTSFERHKWDAHLKSYKCYNKVWVQANHLSNIHDAHSATTAEARTDRSAEDTIDMDVVADEVENDHTEPASKSPQHDNTEVVVPMVVVNDGIDTDV